MTDKKLPPAGTMFLILEEQEPEDGYRVGVSIDPIDIADPDGNYTINGMDIGDGMFLRSKNPVSNATSMTLPNTTGREAGSVWQLDTGVAFQFEQLIHTIDNRVYSGVEMPGGRLVLLEEFEGKTRVEVEADIELAD